MIDVHFVPRLDKVLNEHIAVCEDGLLRLLHVAEAFQLLAFAVFLMLRVNCLNVDLLHAEDERAEALRRLVLLLVFLLFVLTLLLVRYVSVRVHEDLLLRVDRVGLVEQFRVRLPRHRLKHGLPLLPADSCIRRALVLTVIVPAPIVLPTSIRVNNRRRLRL